MEIILAIDGGGSRTRCLAIDKRGCVVGGSESGPSNHLLVAREIVIGTLRAATDEALARGRVQRTDALCVSAGLAGVDYDGTGALEMEEVFRELGFARPIVNGDMVIAHYGALGGHPGILALAGTGSSILGIGAQGERVKIGGWGPVYGDEGSAYWIARQSLVMAARNYDSRGPDTALLGAILQALGLKDFKETVSRIYVDGMEARDIARLSRVAYEVALAGDPVARRIFTLAGEEVAEGVAAAIRRLGSEEQVALVSYQGSILESCDLVRETFITSLQRLVPRVSVLPPRFDPVIGAYLLGCEAMGWTIDSHLLQRLEEQSIPRMKGSETTE